jgi:hypothetical protein
MVELKAEYERSPAQEVVAVSPVGAFNAIGFGVGVGVLIGFDVGFGVMAGADFLQH